MSYEKLNDFIVMIDDMVWGVPLIVLIMAVGLLLTVCSKGIQFRCLGEGFRAMFKKTEGDGEVSSFEALCTALSATIGTG
ncbi:MAG: sodium:alanine symporter family protein, partial [Oscillospiraceae bacterium]|nr:sodium:alanine symporter family protein [Oscillospiraceae bacterium]